MTTLPPTKKGRRSKERILEAARDVFANVGYIDTRVQDIAEEAGFALGSIYRYFDSKDDVFSAVLRDVQHELLDHTRTGSLRTELPAAIHHANVQFLAFWSERAGLLRAFNQAEVINPVYQRAALRTRNAFARRFVASLQRHGFLDEAHADEAAGVISTLVLGTEAAAVSAFAHKEAPLADLPLDELAAVLDRLWLGTLGHYELLTQEGRRALGQTVGEDVGSSGAH